MPNNFTTIRIRKQDYSRVKFFLSCLKKTKKVGSFALPDVLTLSLDSYEENINKKKGISTAQTEEIPKN